MTKTLDSVASFSCFDMYCEFVDKCHSEVSLRVTSDFRKPESRVASLCDSNITFIMTEDPPWNSRSSLKVSVNKSRPHFRKVLAIRKTINILTNTFYFPVIALMFRLYHIKRLGVPRQHLVPR